MTPAGLGDRVHFIYHDYRHTISIYVVRNKKEKGCLPVVYLLDILLVLSVSILEPKYDCVFVYRIGLCMEQAERGAFVGEGLRVGGASKSCKFVPIILPS